MAYVFLIFVSQICQLIIAHYLSEPLLDLLSTFLDESLVKFFSRIVVEIYWVFWENWTFLWFLEVDVTIFDASLLYSSWHMVELSNFLSTTLLYLYWLFDCFHNLKLTNLDCLVEFLQKCQGLLVHVPARLGLLDLIPENFKICSNLRTGPRSIRIGR